MLDLHSRVLRVGFWLSVLMIRTIDHAVWHKQMDECCEPMWKAKVKLYTAH